MNETDRRRLELAGLACVLTSLDDLPAAGELARRALDSARAISPDEDRWAALDELALTARHFGAPRAAGKLAIEATNALIRAGVRRGQGWDWLDGKTHQAVKTLVGLGELDMATEVIEYAFSDYYNQEPEIYLALAEARLASGDRARAIEAATVGWRESKRQHYSDRTCFDDELAAWGLAIFEAAGLSAAVPHELIDAIGRLIDEANDEVPYARNRMVTSFARHLVARDLTDAVRTALEQVDFGTAADTWNRNYGRHSVFRDQLKATAELLRLALTDAASEPRVVIEPWCGSLSPDWAYDDETDPESVFLRALHERVRGGRDASLADRTVDDVWLAAIRDGGSD